VIYAMIDGLFQQCLLKHLSGDARAIDQMQADVRLVLSKITKNPAASARVTAPPGRRARERRRG
jgi:hypothetical protein